MTERELTSDEIAVLKGLAIKDLQIFMIQNYPDIYNEWKNLKNG